MKVTDATLDRILQRREKLERKGIVAPSSNDKPTAINVFVIGDDTPCGNVTTRGDHEPRAISLFVIPSGKFLQIEPPATYDEDGNRLYDEAASIGFEPSKYVEHRFSDDHQNVMLADIIARCTEPELPDTSWITRPWRQYTGLVDAPEPPKFAPVAVEHVPDAVIGPREGDEAPPRRANDVSDDIRNRLEAQHAAHLAKPKERTKLDQLRERLKGAKQPLERLRIMREIDRYIYAREDAADQPAAPTRLALATTKNVTP